MHSLTLTEPIRDLHRDRSWPGIDKFTLAKIIEREADVQLAKILKPKRKTEIMCPDCHMILSKQAQSCFC